MNVKCYSRRFKENPPTVEHFNESHAAEAGPWCVLCDNGIPVRAAVALVKKWNRLGLGEYQYSVIFGESDEKSA